MGKIPYKFFAYFDTSFQLVDCCTSFKQHFNEAYIKAFSTMIQEEVQKSNAPFFVFSTALMDENIVYNIYLIGDNDKLGYYMKIL